MTVKTAIAVSGGIDSLVAAHLLKNDGHEPVGIHFLTGYESSSYEKSVEDIREICLQVGIPLYIRDIRKEFQAEVVDYFSRSWEKGLTPNPCLVCNPRIKFGTILDAAKSAGASALATGHYARTGRDGSGRLKLLKGADPVKEQSYFLSFLKQNQLADAVFPLGELTKETVRQIASDNGLVPVSSKESQDICFIKNRSYADFLQNRPGFKSSPGDIVNSSGEIIGKHNGLHKYTIGQRRGINCPASEPYYVIGSDMQTNRLIVGFKDETFSSGCRVRDINWIASCPSSPVRVSTRIRYNHKETPSELTPIGANEATVRFDTPQSAVTPGQGAVFYSGDEVIGAGWIY